MAIDQAVSIGAYPLYRGRVKVTSALWMPNYDNNTAWAIQAVADNPGLYLIMRGDDGRDAGQYDRSQPATSEARRFVDRFILPKLANLPPGIVKAITGPCENWPDVVDKAGLDYRAALEYALCSIVQDELHLDYVALNVPVGCLEPGDLWRFKAVIVKAAWLGYHGYAKPFSRTVESITEPWWAFRPTRYWKDAFAALGLPKRFMFTEVGPSETPAKTGLNRDEQAQLCVDLGKALKADCQAVGAKYGGAYCFAMGAEGDDPGDMGFDWNLDGTERYFIATNPPPPVLPPVPPPMAPAKIRLAVIPSLQGNFVPPSTNEHAQMLALAQQVVTSANRYLNIEAKVFDGPTETDLTNLPYLKAQTAQAHAWLDQATNAFTVALNLHTDSGTASHVGAYWVGPVGSVSQRLATELASVLQPVLQTNTLLSADYGAKGYIFARDRNCPVLLEVGSHQNAHNIEVVRTMKAQIADALTRRLITFFPVDPKLRPVPVDPVDDALNGIAYYLKMAATSSDLALVRQSVADCWVRVARLKTAIGR